MNEGILKNEENDDSFDDFKEPEKQDNLIENNLSENEQ